MDEHYSEYLKSNAWKMISAIVIGRAGNRCQLCNSPKGLQAHHRTYEHKGREMKHLGDLTCLCKRCHIYFHCRTDLRPKVSQIRRPHKKRREKAPKARKSRCKPVFSELNAIPKPVLPPYEPIERDGLIHVDKAFLDNLYKIMGRELAASALNLPYLPERKYYGCGRMVPVEAYRRFLGLVENITFAPSPSVPTIETPDRETVG